MNSNNLIFSSNINEEVEDICFDILLNYFEDVDFNKVYVYDVVIGPSEIMFFINVDDNERIIRVPIKND